MAAVSNGQINTNTEYDSYFWVKWSQVSQNVVSNKTSISWQCGVYCGSDFYLNAIKMSAVSINGTTVYSGGTYSNYSKGNHIIASGSLDIAHNTDGTKTFSISSFTGWLYSNHNYSASGKSFELAAIPRKATITSAPDITDLDDPKILISNPGGFKMSVFIELNPVSDHLCVRENIANTGSYTWLLSSSERDELRRRCSGKQCKVRFFLYSWIGDTVYSDYKDRTFTITETDNTRPAVTVDVSANNGSSQSQFGGLYICGKSKIDVNLSATGKYGASIKKYYAEIAGKTYNSASFTSDIVTTAGSINIIGYAKDSRDFTGSATKQISVVEYSAPWITSFSVERQSDGTTVIASLKGGVSPIANKNTKSFSVTLNGVTKTISSSGYMVDGTATFTNVPTDSTLTATAKISDWYTTTTKNAVLPTVDVTMDFNASGNGIAFGKVSEKDGFECDWDSYFNKNVYVKGASMSPNCFYRASGEANAVYNQSVTLANLKITTPGHYLILAHADSSVADSSSYVSVSLSSSGAQFLISKESRTTMAHKGGTMTFGLVNIPDNGATVSVKSYGYKNGTYKLRGCILAIRLD